MRLQSGQKFGIWLALGLILSLVPVLQAQAPVTITVGVPGYLRGIMEETVVTSFEADNPDINVELVDMNNGPSYDGGDIDTYLDNLGEYVSLADVLIFSESSLIPEATRAGYVMDLSTFVRSDPEINVDDFYPQFWNAFQWDGGIWAFPVAGDVVAVIYNPSKFDEAGLPYPDENWTLADFEMAVRALSTVDATTGEITSSGAAVFDDRSPIILSLLGKSFYDPSNPDAAPVFDDADLQALTQQWYDLTADGLFTQGEGFGLELPLVVSRSATRIGISRGGPPPEGEEEEETTKMAPLPGGHSLLNVNGMGISAGSLHAEEAYRFIKYVSNDPQATSAFLSAIPARKSLVGVEVPENEQGIRFNVGSNDPERLAEIEALLETAYSPSETLYASSISSALSSMAESSYDVATAYDDQEAAFITARDTAAVRNGTVTISVDVPASEVPLAPGEIALKFGVTGFMGANNNPEWQAVIDQFVADDPEVGAVSLETVDGIMAGGLEDFVEDYDCFYENGNSVPSADLSLLVPLDAYLASDSTYNADDMITGALQQVQREGQTWAIPVSIKPSAMWYNPSKVEEAGAFDPYDGWTVGDFETALTALKSAMVDDATAPFISREGNGTYILQLIAAYGALPLDTSQTPPVMDFASEKTIAATKQVLDLARAGYIQYEPLGQFGLVRMIFGDETVYAMYTQSLGGFFNFRGGGGGRGPRGGGGGAVTVQVNEGDGTIAPTYNLVSFPQGSEYVPIAYDISAAYISAQSPYQDACYRFLQTLTKHPGLFGGMPVLRSLLDDESVISTYGQSAVDFYRAVDATLVDPRAARFTALEGVNIAGESLVSLWLYRAWDNYFADENVDLAKELQDAQFYADAYLECLSLKEQETVEPSAGLMDNFKIWRDCAVSVDSSLADVLPDF